MQDYTSIRGDVTLFEPQLERLQRLFDVRAATFVALGRGAGTGAGVLYCTLLGCTVPVPAVPGGRVDL